MVPNTERRTIFKGPTLTVYETQGRFVIYDRKKKTVTAQFTLKDLARWMEYVSEREHLEKDR